MLKNKRRIGDEFKCKHGCGFVYKKRKGDSNANERWERDKFDYHEQQGCPILPRLSCPLKCTIRKTGEVLTFKGNKAYKNHLKSKRHLKNESKVENQEKLHLLKKAIVLTDEELKILSKGSKSSSNHTSSVDLYLNFNEDVISSSVSESPNKSSTSCEDSPSSFDSITMSFSDLQGLVSLDTASSSSPSKNSTPPKIDNQVFNQSSNINMKSSSTNQMMKESMMDLRLSKEIVDFHLKKSISVLKRSLGCSIDTLKTSNFFPLAMVGSSVEGCDTSSPLGSSTEKIFYSTSMARSNSDVKLLNFSDFFEFKF